jgi:hypothetical protein
LKGSSGRRKFQFDAATIRPLIQLAGAELAKLWRRTSRLPWRAGVSPPGKNGGRFVRFRNVERGWWVRCVLSAGRDATALRQAGCPPLRNGGGSRPLPELFAAAGCKFQFDTTTIKALIQLANSELKKLCD